VVAADYPVAQNSYDLAAERGRSAFDVGHAFAARPWMVPALSRSIHLCRGASGWVLNGAN
jgi:hypothetical protein